MAIKYLVIVYKDGEPIVVYSTDFLNRAIEELESLICGGERLVAIEVAEVPATSGGGRSG